MNMGSFTYIAPRLSTSMRSLGRRTFEDIRYVGRASSASTATGFYSFHAKEQIKREIATLKLLKHPNMVRLHEGVLTAKEVYDVLIYRGCLESFPLFAIVHEICIGRLPPSAISHNS